MGRDRDTEDSDQWFEEATTSVEPETAKFLAALDEPTRVMSLDEINRQLAQAFPSERALDVELENDK